MREPPEKGATGRQRKTPTADQMQRLPQWAQRHIIALERRVEEAQREVATLLGSGPGDVRIGSVIGEMHIVPRYWSLEYRRSIRDTMRVQVQTDEGRIRIASDGGRIDIRPVAANSVTIGMLPED